jgi:hypothetical protein
MISSLRFPGLGAGEMHAECQSADTCPTAGGKTISPTKYVGAAGGRIIIPPYPAANELSGIYVTRSARGVDTREVSQRFDNSRPLVPTLRLSLESILFKPA